MTSSYALPLPPQVAAYVQGAFGGVEPCRKAILLDFFRHAFDGSGAGGDGGWSVPALWNAPTAARICAQPSSHAGRTAYRLQARSLLAVMLAGCRPRLPSSCPRRQLLRCRQLHRRPPHLCVELVQQGGLHYTAFGFCSPCDAQGKVRSTGTPTAMVGVKPSLEAAVLQLAAEYCPLPGPQIEKKSYYHVFKLAGFVGFDGDFK